MRNKLNIILILAVLTLPLQTFANGVFKCTDDQGTTTFSFTPCAAPEPETAAEDGDQQPAVSKKAQLEQLDSRISELQAEIESEKREYEDALATATGRQRSDQLTHEFDSDTMRLLSELNTLQAERERVARL